MARMVRYPHPGEILAADFLEPMGITAYRLAQAINVPQTRISQILRGERGITADTALRLSKAFGLSEGFWTTLQASYDAAHAKEEIGDELEAIPLLLAA